MVLKVWKISLGLLSTFTLTKNFKIWFIRTFRGQFFPAVFVSPGEIFFIEFWFFIAETFFLLHAQLEKASSEINL